MVEERITDKNDIRYLNMEQFKYGSKEEQILSELKTIRELLEKLNGRRNKSR